MKFAKMMATGILGGRVVSSYRKKIKTLFGANLVSFLPLDELAGATATDYTMLTRTAGTLLGAYYA